MAYRNQGDWSSILREDVEGKFLSQCVWQGGLKPGLAIGRFADLLVCGKLSRYPVLRAIFHSVGTFVDSTLHSVANK